MRFDTDALVLAQAPYSESSQVVHLLTASDGRITALARGVYRPKSEFGGALDVMTRGEANLSRRRHSELDLLHRLKVTHPYRGLRGSLLTWAATCHVLELVKAFAWVRDREDGLFRLVTATLDALDRATTPEVVETWLAAFALRLLERAGFRPELDGCVGCGDPVDEERARFSLSEGGVVCGRCAEGRRGVVAVSREALALKRRMLSGAAGGRTPTPAAVTEARRNLDRVVEHRLERPLHARLLLEEAAACP